MGFGFGLPHGNAIGSHAREIAGPSIFGQSGRSPNNAKQVRLYMYLFAQTEYCADIVTVNGLVKCI